MEAKCYKEYVHKLSLLGASVRLSQKFNIHCVKYQKYFNTVLANNPVLLHLYKENLANMRFSFCKCNVPRRNCSLEISEPSQVLQKH